MTLKNITKKTVLSKKVLLAKSIKDNFFGLTLSKDPKTMLFHTRFGIHTFGMHYPLDVLILDDDYKVKEIKHSLQPNRIFFWNPRYDIVIELPEGTIEKTKTRVGDIINLQ